MARLLEATTPAEVQSVRELFAQYARALEEPCCFAGFERELAALPRGYWVLFLLKEGEEAAGCVGVRALEPRLAELKRLYVRPQFRGLGFGRSLAEAAIGAARERGFERVVLDSLPKMREALSLYGALGFRETAPYLAEPTPGARCFELTLK